MSNRQNTKSSAPSAGNSSKESDAQSAITPGGDTVDKIRDLIFGEQMSGYEARFNALEARLVGEVDSLRQSVEDSLAKLKTLTEERTNQVEKLSVSRKNLSDSLQKLAESIRD